MRTNKVFGLLLGLWLMSSPAVYADISTLFAQNLQCESRSNPLGVDQQQPVFSWQLAAAQRSQFQSAWQIQVAASKRDLQQQHQLLWDSGKNESPTSLQIKYLGEKLQSSTRYYWRVRVWNEKGKVSKWSHIAHWETALLASSDWQGQWIGDGRKSPVKAADFYANDPAPMFRKAFRIDKTITSARLYISGLGYYEASLNGQRVGDSVLDPGWTAYGKTVLYSSYDVSKQLHTGNNAIGVLVGNGWHNPLPMTLVGGINLRDHLPVGRPQFIAQLLVHYQDGSSEVLVTDTSWKTSPSPLLKNNVYLGEVYDARLEQKGWNSSGFEDTHWSSAVAVQAPEGRLTAQSQEPIRVTRKLPTKKIWQQKPSIYQLAKFWQQKPDVYLFDFGQNFAGWAQLKLRGEAGQKIELRYGELLNNDGSLNAMTAVAGQIKSPGRGGPGAPDIAWQKDVVILSGRGEEHYTPRFTYRGFRYVEVVGLTEEPNEETLTGLRLNADVASAGTFTSSNKRFNAISQATEWTFLSNLFSVQSDCPHREKFGYGGDIVTTTDAFIFNFKMDNLYRKIIGDFSDSVRDNGGVSETAPFVGIDTRGFGDGSGPIGWGIAHPHLLEKLYQYYGDKRAVEQHYAVSKNWLALIAEKADGLLVDNSIGDHENLDSKTSYFSGEAGSEKNMALIGTAFYYAAASKIARLAGIIGNNADEEKYTKLAQKIRKVYIDKFIDPVTGQVGHGSQTAQAFALNYGLVPDELKNQALAVLTRDIVETRNNHLSTGIFGTKFIFNVLEDNDLSDVAFDMVNNDSFPGWGYMLANGATTLWEHWEYSDNTFSHNHPMFGSVDEWFRNVVAGLRVANDAVGADHFVIKPELYHKLDYARASYDSVRGMVVSDWRREGSNFRFKITVPQNTRATVTVPGADVREGGEDLSKLLMLAKPQQGENGLKLEIGGGDYEFTSSL